MITIPAVSTGGVLRPQTAIPTDAVRVTCDGTNYTVYQTGDTLPGSTVTTVPSLTSRQFQLALSQLGYLDAVTVKVMAATMSQQIEWNEAQIFTRNWPLMITVIDTALTSGQLDTVFSTGASL